MGYLAQRESFLGVADVTVLHVRNVRSQDVSLPRVLLPARGSPGTGLRETGLPRSWPTHRAVQRGQCSPGPTRSPCPSTVLPGWRVQSLGLSPSLQPPLRDGPPPISSLHSLLGVLCVARTSSFHLLHCWRPSPSSSVIISSGVFLDPLPPPPQGLWAVGPFSAARSDAPEGKSGDSRCLGVGWCSSGPGQGLGAGAAVPLRITHGPRLRQALSSEPG